MGIRETLNKNPGITTGVTAGIILLALVFIIWQAGGGGGASIGAGKQFYSVDDGATFFEADADKIPPFEHEGKTAVRAHVYTCDDGATKKVAYLERYTDQAKAMMEKIRSGDTGSDQHLLQMEEITMTGVLIKAPGTGDKGWIPQMDQRATQIVTPKCPEGGTIRWVMPE